MELFKVKKNVAHKMPHKIIYNCLIFSSMKKLLQIQNFIYIYTLIKEI